MYCIKCMHVLLNHVTFLITFILEILSMNIQDILIFNIIKGYLVIIIYYFLKFYPSQDEVDTPDENLGIIQ